MRVLHVIPSVSPVHGGATLAVQSMALGLAQAGVEAHIATTDDDCALHLSVPLGCPVLNAGVTTWYFRRQTSFYKFSWPLARWLDRCVSDYDIVHIHALFTFAAVAAARHAAAHAVPFVVHPIGTLSRWGMLRRRPLLKRLSFALIERRVIQAASLVHYTSEAERAEAVGLGVTSPGVIIPLGIALADIPFARGGRWLAERVPGFAGRTVILFLSRIAPKKGLDLLLAAFARLRAHRSDIALLVAGAGETEFVGGLKQLALSLGIDRDIYWAGHLSGADKMGALAAADLFVLPSHSENFGIAVVEAMAAGLPVVISDQVGIHREITAAGAGRTVPCEVAPLAAALADLLDDAGLRATMGAAGRSLAAERYSLSAMTAGLLSAYAGILAPARRAEAYAHKHPV